MTSDADILDRAADRLEKPGQWTRGTKARDSSGCPVAAAEHCARSWCAYGAIEAETAGDAERRLSLAGYVEGHMQIRSLTSWNDRQPSAAPVVAALRETAKRLRGEGK